MASTNDSASRQLGSESRGGETSEINREVEQWIGSLENLMTAVSKSPLDDARKKEILMHMAVIQKELMSGQWPGTSEEQQAVTRLANDMGELEQLANDWKVFSLRLADWVKAISDSLGVR